MHQRQRKDSVVKRNILLAVCVFCLWTVLFLAEKPVFLICYQHSLSHMLPVMAHGLSLDLSMAGYLSAVPFLLLAFGGWIPQGIRRIAAPLYYGLTSAAVALSFVANLGLYSYWRFPLDATPLFYFLSSPLDAVASVSWWVVAGSLLLVAVVMAVISVAFHLLYHALPERPNRKRGNVMALLLLTAALFLPIRGGVTVSSTNTGKAYFSADQLLNHAAVNPLFSFFESVTHQQDFASQYRFMDEGQAKALIAQLNRPSARLGTSPAAPHTSSADSARTDLLRAGVSRPDIYIIILESFSDTLMHQPGVTPHLKRLSQEGVYFSHFYANSFRTDRGLLAILQGFPSPASVSLMKFPKKTQRLSSICAHLKRAGYDTHYYYGGDADFTNMRSFLINQGFEHITEDVDFPLTERLSKWGVPDHYVFGRVERDLRQQHPSRPMLRVIQTSSSHEPYDVPYHRLSDKRLNAFAYTDSCVGAFISRLQHDPQRWQRSLVLLCPDHLGCWPDRKDSFKPWFFHIPLIWVGGALQRPRVIDVPGSQQDIAATLLAQLGLPHRDLPYSKDLLDPAVPHYAYFMMHDGEGIVTRHSAAIYDNDQQRAVYVKGPSSPALTHIVHAYVQRLYDFIAKL